MGRISNSIILIFNFYDNHPENHTLLYHINFPPLLLYLHDSSGAMAGIGSDSSYNPSSGGYGNGAGSGVVDIHAVTYSLVSGFGSAWSTLGSVTSSISTKASTVVNDENNKQRFSDLTSSAGRF